MRFGFFAVKRPHMRDRYSTRQQAGFVCGVCLRDLRSSSRTKPAQALRIQESPRRLQSLAHDCGSLWGRRSRKTAVRSPKYGMASSRWLVIQTRPKTALPSARPAPLLLLFTSSSPPANPESFAPPFNQVIPRNDCYTRTASWPNAASCRISLPCKYQSDTISFACPRLHPFSRTIFLLP